MTTTVGRIEQILILVPVADPWVDHSKGSHRGWSCKAFIACVADGDFMIPLRICAARSCDSHVAILLTASHIPQHTRKGACLGLLLLSQHLKARPPISPLHQTCFKRFPRHAVQPSMDR